ncbi:MAG: S-methyl-5-thioribose-1-phosphate isomerase, partial [Myxococcota bacterium]
WVGGLDGFVRMIDQTLLPTQLEHIEIRTPESMHEAIYSLRVRGAPAIGIAAAYGLLLGVQGETERDRNDFQEQIVRVADYLATSRPTAVNLFWALERMKSLVRRNAEEEPTPLLEILLAEAHAIREEDRQMCRAIGQFGSTLVPEGGGILTHCNAGGLATADYGTALAVCFSAHEQHKKIRVFADETRPLLQGARLTTWELMQRGIDVTLICDSSAAQVMKEGKVDLVVVGSDRVASNGDAANKIGTYGVSILARAHGIPFYVAAPSSTFDLECAHGDDIPIEQRAAEEITEGFGRRTAPDGVQTYAPAFDVTPADHIAAFITEKGILRPPYAESIRTVLGDGAPTAASPDSGSHD